MKRVAIGLIAVLVLAAVGGGAFYAGTKVGENRVLQNPALVFRQRAGVQTGQFPGRFGTPGAGEFPGAIGTPQAGQRGVLGGGIMGTIEGVEGTTLLLSTQEGTIRVQTTDTTLIQKQMSVTVGDLQINEQVLVSGSRNDDGSYTARSIRSMQGMQLEMRLEPTVQP